MSPLTRDTRRIDHLVDLASDLRSGALSASDYISLLQTRFKR